MHAMAIRTDMPLSATAEGSHLSIADRYTQRLIDQDYLRRMPINPFVMICQFPYLADSFSAGSSLS